MEGQYIVLQVDVRGSVGHGREFREELQRDFGGIDVEDVHSGAEYPRHARLCRHEPASASGAAATAA